MSNIFRRGSQREETEEPIFKPGHKSNTEDSIHRVTDIFVRGGEGSIAARFGGTMQLSDLLSDKGLINHLLQANTFFHAKIGFHNLIMAHIHATADIKQAEYVNTEANFPRSSKSRALPTDRITVLPIVESKEALNKLVARSFSKAKAVWLIAPPTSIQTHLLIAFSNFFISTATSEDMASFVEIFQLDDSMRDVLSDLERSKALFVTDYKPLMQESRSASIAVIRLEGLYE